ncbi:MAG: DUF2070 family protein [Candidatus Micrarchaeota archaeon]
MEKPDESQRDLKAVAITKLIAPLPSAKRSILFIVVISFIAGVALNILFFRRLSMAEMGDLLFGGAEGVLLLGLPAILSAAFAASITRKEKFRERLKHFSVIALISVVVASILYIGSLTLIQTQEQQSTFMLLANSIVFIIWFVALFITLNFGWKTLFISLIQPILNVSFLIIYNSVLIADLQDPLTLSIKFIVSSAVLLLALASIFYILNAPARRNFGISTMQVMALFFAQWTYGSKGLEDVLADMGEKVETFYATILLRNSRTKKLKAAWLVPYVHFGPVGNLGGSEFPALLSKPLRERYGVPVSVYHATVNHDFNPVYSSAHEKFLSAYVKEIESLRKGGFSSNFSTTLLESRRGSARIFGMNFGQKSGFFALSNAPQSTEDIEFPLGLILINKLASRGLENVVLADMHNCKADGAYMLAGTPEFYEFYDLIDEFKPSEGTQFKFGASFDSLEDMGIQRGIGKMGMVVSVFESRKKKTATILIDANNVLPEFRREILLRVAQKHKFDFCDVMTTDTHAVNTISGIHNPLGRYCDRKKLIERIEAGIEKALGNMEPTEVAMSMKRIEVDVLGARKSPEVISTINSIVSIAKVFAPSILILSVLIAFLLSLTIK